MSSRRWRGCLPADRAWLASIKAALLVPIFAGGSDPRPLVGVIVLGEKRSEEPYTPEDRELLRGIAVQMGVALDLSRLRQAGGGDAGGDRRSRLDANLHANHRRGRQRQLGDQRRRARRRQVSGRRHDRTGRHGRGVSRVGRAARAAVAIKVVRAGLVEDPDSRARFRRESQIVARLQHPSIVTVYDYGTLADGSAFLVMEFVPGEDLRRFLKREGRLDPPTDVGADDGHLRRRRHRAQVGHLPPRPQAGKHPAAGERARAQGGRFRGREAHRHGRD